MVLLAFAEDGVPRTLEPSHETASPTAETPWEEDFDPEDVVPKALPLSEQAREVLANLSTAPAPLERRPTEIDWRQAALRYESVVGSRNLELRSIVEGLHDL